MPKPEFAELRDALLRGGVAPVYIRRTLLELDEHYLDLERDGVDAGLSLEHAASRARAELGSERVIAAAVLARLELKDWTYRWPRLACCLRSVVLVALLPAWPVAFCVYRGRLIARWSVSVALAMLVTGSLLLSLHWMILHP